MVVEQLVTLAIVALGALAGSLFMWVIVGPLVIKRAAPRVFRDVAFDVLGITETEVAAQNGDVFKAITKKQGEIFAQAIYGAMGNIVQTADTDDLVKKVSTMVPGGAQGLAGLVQGATGGGGLGQLAPLLQMMGGESGNGTKNPFMGLVQMMMAMQLMTQMGGGGGGGLSLGGGSGGSYNPGLPGR